MADTRNESVLLLHENHLEWIKHWERSSFLGERALFSARIAVKRENANSRYLNTGHFVANLLTVWADAVRLRRNSLGTRHGTRTSLSTSLFVRYRFAPSDATNSDVLFPSRPRWFRVATVADRSSRKKDRTRGELGNRIRIEIPRFVFLGKVISQECDDRLYLEKFYAKRENFVFLIRQKIEMLYLKWMNRKVSHKLG